MYLSLSLCRFYKNNAIDFSRLQVCIDTFLFSAQYTDVATLAVLSKYTAGSTYFYPAFASPRDGECHTVFERVFVIVVRVICDNSTDRAQGNVVRRFVVEISLPFPRVHSGVTPPM
jgi:hypothetical protein